MADETPGKSGTLERPDRRIKLIRALASEEFPVSQLALQYGVSTSAIYQFRERHADRIADVRRDIANQFAGIALASKVARVETYSQQVLQILQVLEDPTQVAKAGLGFAELARVAQQGMRAIADELGDIPARVQVQHSGSLEVRINGVDASEI